MLYRYELSQLCLSLLSEIWQLIEAEVSEKN